VGIEIELFESTDLTALGGLLPGGASPGLRIPMNCCEGSVVETTVCSELTFLLCFVS